MSALADPVAVAVRQFRLDDAAVRDQACAANRYGLARLSHRTPMIEDATVPFNVFVMKRSTNTSLRHRGGRSEDAALGRGEIGLVAEGSYGHWTFGFEQDATQDTLHLYLPNTYLSELSQRAGSSASVEMCDVLKLADPVLKRSAAALDAAFDRGPAGRLYIEGLVATLAARLLEHHTTRGSRRLERGGLAPWQVKRACEAMVAGIDGTLGLDELAAIVGCSPTHFSRAFKQSTGLAPFHWLAELRIERAKVLLADNRLPLAEIALAVGFSAQPQFTTAFGRATGMTPARWRRERMS